MDAAFKRFSLRNKSFYLVPLQLDRDSQISVHSDLSGMAEFADRVMQSFKAKAPASDILVFKNHPLDCGCRKMKATILALASKHGLSKRLVFIDAGKLPYLLACTKGVITVNSTAGLSAITHSKKLIALGRAIYNFEGLTYQGSLDDFWNAEYTPNIGLLHKFRQYLLETRQVNGCHYSAGGRRILADNLLKVFGFYQSESNVIHADFRGLRQMRFTKRKA